MDKDLQELIYRNYEGKLKLKIRESVTIIKVLNDSVALLLEYGRALDVNIRITNQSWEDGLLVISYTLTSTKHKIDAFNDTLKNDISNLYLSGSRVCLG